MLNIMKDAFAVSPATADTIRSSLAWSGASRFISGFGSNETNIDTKVYDYLMGLASKVGNPSIRPTAESVIERLKSEPTESVVNTDEESVKMLTELGVSNEELNAALRKRNKSNKQRFSESLAHILEFEDDLRVELDKAFNKKNAKWVDPSEGLTTIIEAKILTKLRERHASIIASINDGTFTGSPTEVVAEGKRVKELIDTYS